MSEPQAWNGSEVAIIGMAGRFPGAGNLQAFWRNLRDGVHSISFFSEEELRAAGVSRELLDDPHFVKAGGVLDSADLFDAAFFGFSAREAEIMDPQQRVLLETAWEALEDAGYDSEKHEGAIAVYAGLAHNTYLYNLLANPEVVKSVGTFQLVIGSEKDFLAPRISYKLNLKGPSVVVQTACSTSLVAVHLACQGLVAGECQIALAGGGAITFPQTTGYLYQEGGVNAPDGFCRAFDAKAQGTVASRGVGIVVLKCLENALADGDHIYAVIKGSAINNDGANKVGFTAPGVEGQAGVVRAAQALAEVDPGTITYIEAHGTGTELGDPIEVAALTKAFRKSTERKGFCAIGSLKSNIGHLDTAAGVAGLIKTVLALEHKQIPPSLHFEQPNPKIRFEDSPFFVNAKLADWPANGTPRRAGVSSFGIGGTNAHVVLEEAPVGQSSGSSRSHQLLVLSAKTASALETATDCLAAHLREHPEQPLPDIAFTTQMGRRGFSHRRILVCHDHLDAASALEERSPQRVLGLYRLPGDHPVAFLFPGQGTQYVNMAHGPYSEEPVFRHWVEECAAKLAPHLGVDLLQVLYPPSSQVDEAGRQLLQTAFAQPALFVVEYALTRLWMEWGVHPQAMIGHSIGEYVAACLAGVMSLDDALALVAARGRLMQGTAAGAMLAVPLPEPEVAALLDEHLSLAAVNGPSLTVVSGNIRAIEGLEMRLAERQVEAKRLHTSHAFHSHLMDPILGEFAKQVECVRLEAPRIAFISNVTGKWITPAQATDPAYWVRHARDAVRFADGLATLFKSKESLNVLIEVGPGSALGRLATSHPEKSPKLMAIPSLRGAQGASADQEMLLGALGRVWLAGCEIDWRGFYGHERRGRVSLPTYPFERQRYWIDAAASIPTPSPTLVSKGVASPVAIPTEAGNEVPRGQTRHPRPEMPIAYVAARSANEKCVVAIWEELLGIEPIGVHDNFFELGGHSLMATQMAAALRQALNLNLPLRKIFEAPTPATQAAIATEHEVDRVTRNGDEERLPMLIPDPIGRYQPFPMTDIQQAYWIGRSGSFQLGQVATHAYVEVEERNLDLGRLSHAWQRLIDRHDMLRAIFLPEGQQQVLDSVPPYHIEVLDLRGVAPNTAESRLQTVRQRMSHQVLPAHQWPLFELRASLLEPNIIRIHFSFDLLIGDAWSWRILMFELLKFYQDPELRLPSLGLSFRDYVLATLALQETGIYRRSLKYWQDRLDSLPPAPDLPLSKALATLERPVFKRHNYQLPAEQWQQLKSRATRRGLTSSGVLLAAFSEVLAVWCRNSRFTINLTLFNRLPLHPEVDRLVGDFTSLTLLAVDCSKQATFEARAQELQHQLFDDLDHRYVSAVRVLRELARLRPEARTLMPVVFTSTLALQEAPQDGEPAEERVFDGPDAVVYSISQTPQVLLDHQVGEQGGNLVINWDAVEEVFPAGMLDDLFGAYCHLLQRLAAGEEPWKQPRLELLPAWQIQQQTDINATSAPLPAELLHTPFARWAEEQPDQPAVIWSEGSLTYGELNRRANQLAWRLRRLGARPNQLVAVSMEKGWEQVVAVLAVLRAGAAYLPVDPLLPQERRFFLLQHGDVELVITRSSSSESLPAGMMAVSMDDPSLQDEDEKELDIVQGRYDLAYVIFTSGSTGLPKGVMIQHRGAVNTIMDVNQRYAIGPRDRVLAISALNFDLSVYDIFGLLAAGGAIVMPDAARLRDPGHWADLMIRAQVTLWNSVPALMQMLADYEGGKGKHLPESLCLVMLSGDWIPIGLPDQIRQLGDDIRLFSLGGATEASIWSIDYPITEVDPSWSSVPYGRPMLNQTFYVLNSRLEPCPVWTPGDLFIGGVGLAAGYWKDEEKTRASFITHPVTGERLYRTGDLGRWLPDGNIEFLGREDFQVKVQGHRIELGEIEAVLLQHPALKVAVVTAIGEQRGSKRLAAYVVFKDDKTVAIEDLTIFLREKLPGYMVPSAFVPLPELPLTANGKVDRSALPAPDQDVSDSAERTLVALRDHVEFELVEIWKEILHVDQVGIRDNFFHLGGHSVLAVRLMAQVERRLGVELSIATLFEQPTIEELAALIRGRRGASPDTALVPIQPKGSMPPFFWIHPVGGTVFCYAPLARALGSDQPFFAFQSLASPAPSSETHLLEKMASDYCRELRSFQPTGPYFLGGWSMGGTVAFEMARQLQAAGQEVAHLAIVDALAPLPGLLSTGSFENFAILSFAYDLGISLGGSDIDELTRLAPPERFASIFERAKAQGIVTEDERARARRLFEICEYNRVALTGYTGKGYRGDVLLLRAAESDGPSHLPLLGWDELIQGEIESHRLPGNHFSILAEPGVQQVARILKDSVRQLQVVNE